MNLLDEICHEWAARALGLAIQQLSRPPHYPRHLVYWLHQYNGEAISCLANRIIRTRMAQDQEVKLLALCDSLVFSANNPPTPSVTQPLQTSLTLPI